MSQGIRYTLTVDGRVMPFKRLRTRVTSGKIDASCKLKADGTVNARYDESLNVIGGFTRTVGDLSTVFVTCFELLGEDDDAIAAIEDVQFFQEGTRYDLAWSVAYDGVPLYSGLAFYFSETNLDGAIPGEGSAEFSFESTDDYTKHY